MMCIPLLALCLMIHPPPAAASGQDSTDSRHNSDTNIRRFRDHFYLKAIASRKVFRLEFSDARKPGYKMSFEPNLGTYAGFGIFIFDIGLEVQFRNPPGKSQNEIYGPTEGQDWQIYVYMRKTGFEFSYQEYKGFYLTNPSDYYPSWSDGQPYPRQEDMRARTIHLGSYYVFRPNRYSFPSIFNQTEAQLVSGGSWLMSGSINLSEISDPVSIIPITDTNQINTLQGLRNVNVTTINALPGYSHNFIIKQKFYLNLSLAIGVGYQFRSYSTESIQRDRSVNIANSWRVGGGYNGPLFFCGITAYTEQNNISIQDLNITASGGFFKIFAGYRFREKGFMKKSVLDLFR